MAPTHGHHSAAQTLPGTGGTVDYSNISIYLSTHGFQDFNGLCKGGSVQAQRVAVILDAHAVEALVAALGKPELQLGDLE